MLRKFTNTEGPARPVSPDTHKAIQAGLQRGSKTSARELTDEERDYLRTVVDRSDSQ